MKRPENIQDLLPRYRPEPELDPEVVDAIDEFFTVEKMPTIV